MSQAIGKCANCGITVKPMSEGFCPACRNLFVRAPDSQTGKMRFSEKTIDLLHEINTRKKQAIKAGGVGFAITALVVLGPKMVLTLFYEIKMPGYNFTLLIPLIVGIYLYAKKLRTDKIILWLRQFNQKEFKKARFYKILEEACNGMGVAIAIQDSIVRTSLSNISSLHYIWMQTLLIGGVILTFILAVFLMDFMQLYPFAPRVWLIFIILVILCGFLAKKIIERMGVMALDEIGAKRQAKSLLTKILYRNGFILGIQVVRCNDSSWQKTLEFFIKHSDAIIFDVTEITESLLWELKTAFRVLSPDSILLICKNNSANTSQKQNELKKHFESKIIEQMPILFYPAELPRGLFSYKAKIKLEAAILQKALAYCIEHSKKH